MMDAFTAQDTMDIMLAPSEGARASAPVGEAPATTPEEPVVFSRRRDLAAEEAEKPLTTDLTVEQPVPTPAVPEKEKKDRKRSPALFGGESKFFGLFMLLAALVLAVILLVGIFTGQGEETPDATEGTYISLPLTVEGPYAL